MGQVYDPITKKVVTVEQAKELMRQRSGGEQVGASLGVENPLNDDQSMGFALPPVASNDAQEVLNAFPQIGGMIAQFTPAGRTMKGAMAVPALVDMVMQLLSKGDVDLGNTAVNAGMGAVGKGVGNTLAGIGNVGKSKILKSLGIPANEATDATVEMMPKLAMEEGARLTKSSEAAIRAKGNNTGAMGLVELADAMGKSRRADAVGPARDSAWINEVMVNLVRNPRRQMAVGQAMANPFGVNMTDKIAPTGEISTRALMALLASQMGADEEPPMETSRGPRRRPQE